MCRASLWSGSPRSSWMNFPSSAAERERTAVNLSQVQSLSHVQAPYTLPVVTHKNIPLFLCLCLCLQRAWWRGWVYMLLKHHVRACGWWRRSTCCTCTLRMHVDGGEGTCSTSTLMHVHVQRGEDLHPAHAPSMQVHGGEGLHTKLATDRTGRGCRGRHRRSQPSCLRTTPARGSGSGCRSLPASARGTHGHATC